MRTTDKIATEFDTLMSGPDEQPWRVFVVHHQHHGRRERSTEDPSRFHREMLRYRH